jgi:hypothetical protein
MTAGVLQARAVVPSGTLSVGLERLGLTVVNKVPKVLVVVVPVVPATLVVGVLAMMDQRAMQRSQLQPA